jgi:hypothetical protein
MANHLRVVHPEQGKRVALAVREKIGAEPIDLLGDRSALLAEGERDRHHNVTRSK